MGDGQIPAGIDEVTPQWLSAAMAADLGGATVIGVEPTLIGEGVGIASAVYRVALTLDDPTVGPGSVVVKLPALDEAAHFTSTAIRMYHREVSFFGEVAPTCPFGVPECYVAESDPETGAVVIVMEDLGRLRPVDQLEGARPADAATAIEAIARLHARWWGLEDEIGDLEAVIPVDDPLYPMVLPALFDEGWARAVEGLTVPDSLVDIGPVFGGHIEGLMRRLAAAPQTFCHGDWRIDNLMFDTDGVVTALDFQLGARAVGGFDLAYFTSQSLTVEDRRLGEAGLIERYRATALGAGVPAADLERLEDDYDHAALFCLVYPVIALRGVELDDTRGVRLMQVMIDRVAAVIGDRDLARLLPAS